MFILAVDDAQNLLEGLVTELMKVFPQANIHGETEALAAAEWVKCLKEENNTLAYAFLDIHMRGMNGLELARQSKTIHPDANLIFCTAYTEHAFDAFGMFAKGYLLKPVDKNALLSKIHELIG